MNPNQNPKNMRSASVAVPPPQALAQAIEQHPGLAGLAARLAQSDARFAAIRAALPEGLRGEVRAGPIDDEGWSLLASNAAVAAKLRQLLPRLQQTLHDQGWPELTIRLRIRSP